MQLQLGSCNNATTPPTQIGIVMVVLSGASLAAIVGFIGWQDGKKQANKQKEREKDNE